MNRYRWPLAVIFIGLALIGAGLFQYPSQDQNPVVEILSQEETVPVTIWVDAQGALLNPGVYELPGNARINDLLIRAGGLAANADREWLAKNINLAQTMTDGAKIYIPHISEAAQSLLAFPDLDPGQVTAKVNLNTAADSELKELWGIGEARVAAIISARPFLKIEELIEKKIVPQNVYDRIKEKITAF